MKLRSVACLIGALAIGSAPFVLAVSGGGFPSMPQFSSVGVGRAASSGITKIVTDNGGSGDSEIVSGTTTAGDAYFRSIANGVTNWSAGVQRASSQYRICNSVGLLGTCATLSTAGALTTPGSITASSGNISANSTSGGVQVAVTNTDASNNGAFAQGDFCNSGHCLHTLTTGSAQSTAFISNGVAGEASYVYTDVIPLCIGTASNCRLLIDGSGNITAPGAGSVPWTTQTTATTTPTVTAGCTTTPTITWRFVKTGSTVTMSTDGVSCTSNATTFFMPGSLPSAAYEPAHSTFCLFAGSDSGKTGITPIFLNFTPGSLEVDAQLINSASNAFTASGTKALSAFTCTYSLL